MGDHAGGRFSPHLNDAVFRLCWFRKYVYIPHGGGVTPVTQTPDTDLNGHVRPRYVQRESLALIEQMRDGKSVPSLPEEECIELMVAVWEDRALHLAAADGYIKTGERLPLDDDTQDHECVREADVFFKELDMRTKLNAAVADVREEAAAGRLRWTMSDVKRLIREYPSHKKTDERINAMKE